MKRKVLREPIETSLCFAFLAFLIMAGSVTGTDSQQMVTMSAFIALDAVIAFILFKYGRRGE